MKVSFKRSELVEVRRVLNLIIQEDEAAEVNIDAASREAKASAARKIVTALKGEVNRRLAEHEHWLENSEKYGRGQNR